MIGPLWRRAALRLTAEGPWAILVVTALVLLSTAAAAGPMVRSAAANAAAVEVLDSVPAGAPANRAPVIRITDGEFRDEGRSRLEAELARVPGAGPPTVTAQSWYADRLPFGTSVVQTVEMDGESSRGRLFGVEDPLSVIVPVDDGDAVPEAVPDGGPPAVHLAAPIAQSLGAEVGDIVDLRLESGPTAGQDEDVEPGARARVAGIFRVDESERRPMDPPGSTFWADRLDSLPRDVQFRTLRSDLVVADPLTAQALAGDLDDQLLWVTEAQLDPRLPTLAELEATGEATVTLARRVVRPGSDNVDGPLRVEVVSGLETIAARAGALGDAGAGATVVPALGGVLLALSVVLALAVLGAARRRIERQVAVGMGIRPSTSAGLAVVELLVPAVLALAVGVALAWGLITLVGPDGPIEVSAVRAGVAAGAAWLLAGLIVTAGVSAVVTWGATRPDGEGRHLRLPWVVLLVAVATTTTAGLVLGGGDAEALDLAVPLLLIAAVGAVGARLLLAAVRRRGARPHPRRTSGGLDRGTVVAALALRRVTAGGDVRLVIVTLVTAALGLGAWVVTGREAVEAAVVDKNATRVGAAVTVDLDGDQLGLIYPEARRLPPPLLDDEGFARTDPVTGRIVYPDPGPVADLRVEPGDSVVFDDTIRAPGVGERFPLLVIDTDTFPSAAAWGTGPDLGSARQAVDLLGGIEDSLSRDDADSDTFVVPVVIAGNPGGLRVGDSTLLTANEYTVPAEIVDIVPVFPGLAERDRFVMVAATNAMFTRFGVGDPRLIRPTNFEGFPSFRAALFSSRPTEDVLSLAAPAEPAAEDVATLAEGDASEDFFAARLVADYRLALAGLVAGVGLVALALFADRNATSSRASSVVLARTPVGRGGAVRALVLELALLVAVASALAAAGVGALLPLAAPLLDPAPDLRPGLVAGMEPVGVAALVVGGVVAWGVAAVVTVTTFRARAEEEVLRDDD